MINSNIVERVFRISHKSSEATAFTFENGQAQYLASASHVFETEPEEIKIYKNKSWQSLPVEVVWNDREFADIIIFRLRNDLSPRHPINLGTDGVTYSSWVYFMGFPLGLVSQHGMKDLSFPLPFVKAALVSNIDFTHHGLVRFFLDGHNNRGFSGGPVVQMNDGIPSIMGTISSYENERLLHNGKPTEYFSNAGIIVASWDKNLLSKF